MTAPAAAIDHTPLIAPARAAMVALYRRRVATYGALEVPTVSAIDLYAHLDTVGVGDDRRWSGVIFTMPRGLWRRVGYRKNPRRHDSPTPMFALVEERAQELGL